MRSPKHLMLRGAPLLLLIAGVACSGSDGADGTNGSNGTDGTNGSDGTACTVDDNGDGTVTITCEDGTEVTVSDGDAGSSCTVEDNGDGTKTITCDDDTTVTVNDGQDVTIVANEACLVCHNDGKEFGIAAAHMEPLDLIDPTDDIAITAANVVTGTGTTFSITFSWDVTYPDGYGNEVLVNPMTPRSNGTDTEYVRFFVAKHVPGTDTYSSDTWMDYAGQRTLANLVDNNDGTYTYTFSGDYTADYDASATHRVGLQVYHLEGFKVVNDTFDWVPAGGTPASHAVVNMASCNECHGSFSIHGGGRVETEFCVFCHNETHFVDDEDVTNPLDLDFPVMIHKIHSSQMVDSHDYTEVTYPQDLGNCTKCHNGADTATPEGDNWKNSPNRKACGACHSDVNFATGEGHSSSNFAQANDISCLGSCHSDAAVIAGYHANEEITPNNPDVPVAGLSDIAFELHAAAVSDAGVLTVTFSVLRDGTALDVLSLPADLTAAGRYPSFLLPYALPQGGIDAPADYNNLGNTAGQPGSASIGDLLTDGDIAAGATAGQFVATIADAYPDGATMRAVGMQGYFRQTISDVEYARHSTSVAVAVTDDEVRRVVVDNAKCLMCHEPLALHGGNRVNEVAVCVMCHNPNLTSSGTVADPTTLPEATVAALGDNPLLYPEEPMNMKDLIHATHAGETRDRNFDFVRNRNGGLYYDFAEITFPGILNDCETCHLAPNTRNGFNSYLANLPAGVLPTTAITTSGDGATRDELIAARENVPNATDMANSPFASTCYGCHATQPVEAHIESNGGIIVEPRNMTGLGD